MEKNPDIKRLYYSTNEVCKKISIEPHILRSWENRFTKLSPVKKRSGRIQYRPHDLAILLKIKSLKAKGLTDNQINDALQKKTSPVTFASNYNSLTNITNPSPRSSLVKEIISDLQEILTLIDTSL